MQRIQGKLSFSNVVAVIALFVALGGSAYAATQLPKNSVGTKQLKKGAVTGEKVKAGSLEAIDFKGGQGLPGERGPQGPAGPQGIPGTSGVPASVATEVVNASTATDTSTPKEMTAHCPNGPVLGGGFVVHTGDNSITAQGHLRAVRSYPVDANTWLVRATDDTAAESWQLTVSAVCEK
jgi:hypothetical protein